MGRADFFGSAHTCIIQGIFCMSIRPAIKARLKSSVFPAVLQNRFQAGNKSAPSPDDGLSTFWLCPCLPDTAFSTDCHRTEIPSWISRSLGPFMIDSQNLALSSYIPITSLCPFISIPRAILKQNKKLSYVAFYCYNPSNMLYLM